MPHHDLRSRIEPFPRSGGESTRLMQAGCLGFAALSPISYAGAQMAAGLALLAFLVALARGRVRYAPTPLDLPLLIFVAAEILSIVFSVHPARSLRCLRGDWILLFFPVFAQAMRSRRDVERAFRTLLISSSLVGAYAVWQMFAGRDLIRDRALEPIGSIFIATGAFGHHLTYGGHVLLTATLALAWLAFRGGTAARPGGAGARGARAGAERLLLAIVQAGGLLASSARTAWLGFLAGACATVFLLRGRTRRLVLAIGAAGTVLALASPVIRERLQDVLSFHDDPRVRLWQTALRIWWDHPVFGAGLGSYKTQFPIYKVPGDYMATGHPHNDLLNILVHSGILGLAAFAFIWVRYGRMIRRALIAAGSSDPRRPLLLAGVIVPLAFLAGGLGQCFLSDEEVGTLFWFLTAGFVAAARAPREEPDALP